MSEGRLRGRTNTEPTDTAKDSPLSERPRHRAVSRKRPHEGGDVGGGTAVKTPKSEMANDHFSPIVAVNVHPSHQAAAAAAADPTAQGWIRSRSDMTRRTPWSFPSSSESLRDYSNTWWLHSARKDLNAFRAPPLYLPSFARQQPQAVHLRAAREFLQRSYCTQQLPQPCFLAPPHLWPPSWSRAAARSR